MPSALQNELAQTELLQDLKTLHTRLTKTIEQSMADGYTVDQILDAFEIPGSEHFADFVAMTMDDVILNHMAEVGVKPPKRLSPAARARRLAGNQRFIGR